MDSIIVKNNVIPIKYRPKAIKSIIIRVEPEEVTVSYPHYAGIKKIKKFVEAKSEWISIRLARSNENCLVINEIIKNGVIEAGGKKYDIIKIPQNSRNIIKDEIIYFAGINEMNNNIDIEMFILILRKLAKNIINEKVERYASLYQCVYGAIRIKDNKSSWGSCSTKGNLNFNWRIILAPEEILDYVVIHEVCHLKHFNHSQEFWTEVGKHMPEYKQKRLWLKENGKNLRIIKK